MMRNARMKRAFVALPALALAVLAASERDLPAKPAEAADIRLEASRLLPAHVLTESTELAAPTDIEVMGNSLVIADAFADRQLRVLHRSDGETVRAFGRAGRGPREFESVWSLDVIDGHRFMVHDLMLQRVTWVDLEKDFQGDQWVADRSLKLKANAQLMETAWTAVGMVGVGTFHEGRLGHLDEQGRLVRITGDTPMAGADEVPPSVRQMAYQARLKPNPSRTRWAVATRHADRLEIYDGSGSLVAEGTRPYRFDPTFQVTDRGGEPAMGTDGSLRFGYLDLATTSDRIYALFSGRTRAEGSANYGRTLHVFDWSGNLLEVLALDTPVIALAVDPEAETLYGIRHDPAPAIVTFDLETARGE